MSLPESSFAIAVLIALAVPGIVFSTVRTFLRGYSYEDKDLASRLSQAITVSVVLVAVYMMFFSTLVFRGLELTTGKDADVVITDASLVGMDVAIFAVAVPAALAAARYGIPWSRWSWPGELRRALSFGAAATMSSAPTAWDFAARSRNEMYVRIWRPENDSGRWIGGWYSGGSYMSSYPEARDLFIALPFNMGADGSFTSATENSVGLWITIRDDDFVEWLAAPES